MRVRLVAWTTVDEQALEEEGYQVDKHDRGRQPGDQLAEFAGRACYESWGRPNPVTATNAGYMDHILDVGHYSILEHASFTFVISGVSRSFTHELVRHRHLSFSQKSQRYVDESKSKFIPPPGASPAEILLLADLHARALWTYKQVLAERESHGAARKNARQAARAALLNSNETKIVVTGNVRAWREVILKRHTPAADVEFYAVAEEILKHLIDKVPNSVQDLPLDPSTD